MTRDAGGATLHSRLSGLGSIYGKTVRDSRRALLIQALVLGGLPLLILPAIAGQYATPEARREIVRMASATGTVAQGMTGPPVNVGTIGGYFQWKYGAVLLLVAAFWSVLTLTRTLAGEAATGSLDLLAATPASRRRIALEKIAAHLTLLTLLCVVVAVGTGLGGGAADGLPGDEIPLRAAVGFGAWIGVTALAFGGLGLALAQLLGRSTAAWIAGSVLVIGPFLNNYRTLAPGTGVIADLTPWAWTADHLPLAGRFDWPSLIPVAVVGVLLLGAGIEAFVRRDVDAAVRLRTHLLPTPVTGLSDPLRRSLSEHLPLAVAWGLGLAAFGLTMAAISGSLADSFATSPDLAQTLQQAFPLFDVTSAGGFLQLMVQLLFIVAGFAAVTLISRWSADETAGRLELVLATSVSRSGWVARSGLGVLAALAVMTVLISVGIGLGALIAGSDPGAPMLGAASLGLFAAALAGIGFAVGGVVRAGVAAVTVAAVVIVTYLVDLLVPVLQLPDGVRQIALTAHLGRPMVGVWDIGGVLACAVLAFGGLALGAVGLAHRDLKG